MPALRIHARPSQGRKAFATRPLAGPAARPASYVFCSPYAPASFVLLLRESQQPQRGVSCVAAGCDHRCEPVRAHSRPSQLQPQFLHEGGRVAYVAVQRGGGRPLLEAENRVAKFVKSGVAAPPTTSAMTACHNSSSVEAARRYERTCRRPCKGHAKGTSQGRKCMAEGRTALSGPRMYAEGLDAGSLKSLIWVI